MLSAHTEEFDRLVAAEHPGPEVYARIIERLVTVTDAKAGAFWNCEQLPYVPIAHYSVGQAAKLGFTQADHDRILSQVVQQQRSAVVRTGSLDGSASPFIFFTALKGQRPRIVELVFPSSHPIGESREFLHELNRLCEVLSKLQPISPDTSTHSTNSIENATVESATRAEGTLSLATFSRFTDALHSSIDPRLTCANIANETRQLLDCDRVSVVLWQRRRFRIVAISGLPSVNRRSNTVQSLEKLAAEVLKAKSQLWYPADDESVPQIKRLLDTYLLLSAARSLIIQPITARAPLDNEDPESNYSKDNNVIGGIIYEHARQTWDQNTKSRDLKLTTLHASTALRNAKQHRDLFLYPLWRWLGKSKLLTVPGLLPKSLVVLTLIVAIGLFLALWPAAFYISASGVLVPQHRQLIFPKTPGEVVSVQVEHGQWVKQGEPVAILRSDDLRLRLEDVNGRMETLKQRRSAMERSKFKNVGTTPGSASSIDENLGALQAEIDSLERQAEGLKRMETDLRVVSPVAGQVITWDVIQKLAGRTVTPQNVLMEIADTGGPWQLELELEDRRIEHLMRGLKSSSDTQLHVQFTLAANPGRTYEGKVTEVSQAVQLSHDNQQVMRVKVDIDEEALELKQARTGVSAKIYTGETTSLGYLWLHEVPRALNRYVFFYFVR